MLPKLLAEHGHGLVIQRHADRFAALRFVGMNPCSGLVIGGPAFASNPYATEFSRATRQQAVAIGIST
jgi:hypothetical protein